MQRIRLSQRVTMRCVRCQRTWASASFSRYCCDGCMQGNSHCDTCTAVVSPDDSKAPPRSPPSVSRGRKKSRERHTHRFAVSPGVQVYHQLVPIARGSPPTQSSSLRKSHCVAPGVLGNGPVPCLKSTAVQAVVVTRAIMQYAPQCKPREAAQ